MFKVISVFLILFSASQFACTKSSKLDATDPKGVLTAYISKSFAVKGVEDRTELASYMTGDVKARLASWSEDQFRAAFVDSKREFIKLSFREAKDISAHEVQITYELSFFDHGKNKNGQSRESKVTDKKLCQMTLVDGKWYISDVRNIKELVEFKNELSLP
ncbi:MAG: hypothetical protein ABIQ95_05645 [Bdellovibrionia bacterium]